MIKICSPCARVVVVIIVVIVIVVVVVVVVVIDFGHIYVYIVAFLPEPLHHILLEMYHSWL